MDTITATTDTTTSDVVEDDYYDMEVKTLFENDPGNKRCRFTFRTPNAEIVFTYGDREEGIALASNFISLVVEASDLAKNEEENEVPPFDIEFTNDAGFDAADL